MTALRKAPNFGGVGYASPKHPAYFLVLHGGHTLLAKVLWISDPQHRSLATNLGTDWMLGNNTENCDAWGDSVPEVVLEDEVPDRVWVEIAKAALLGDDLIL